MANVATLTAKMAFDIGDYMSKSKTVTNDLRNIGAQAKASSGGVGSLSSSFAGGVTGALAFSAAMKVAGGIMDWVKNTAHSAYDAMERGIKLFAEYEQAKIGFGTLLGGDEAAGGLMKDLDKFALATPFDSSFSRTAASQLLVSKVSREELIPTMTLLGDLAQGNAEKFDGLSRAYGQTLLAGKLTGTDTLQYLNAQVDIYGALEKTLKKTTPELLAMRDAGMISANDVRNALIDLGGTKFADGMSRQTGTVAGQFSMLQEKLDSSFRKIAESFEGTMKDVLATANRFADAFEKSGVPFLSEKGSQTVFGLRHGAGKVSDWMQQYAPSAGGDAIISLMEQLRLGGPQNSLDGIEGWEGFRPKDLAKLPQLERLEDEPERLRPKSTMFGDLVNSIRDGAFSAVRAAGTAGERVAPLLSDAASIAGRIGGLMDGPEAARERGPQAGLVAGSSEAMSAIIQNAFKQDKKDEKDEKRHKEALEVLKAIKGLLNRTADRAPSIVAAFSG